MLHPAISVVVPLYNKAEFVCAAVRSALGQTPPVLEVVVVDDGSTDPGGNRVAALGDSRVRLVRQPNGGVSAARNRGIDEARGEYVAFLDADDRYRPGYVEAITRMIAAFPGAGLYATRFVRVRQDGIDAVLPARGFGRGPDRVVEDFYRAWSREPLFFTSSVCVRRSIFLDEGIRFPEGERLGEDQDVWFRVAERHTVVCSPKPLVEYRIGVEGSLTTGAGPVGILPCYRRLADRVDAGVVPARLIGGARRLVSSHWINAARVRFDAGDRRGAATMLLDRRARANLPYWLRALGTMLAGLFVRTSTVTSGR